MRWSDGLATPSGPFRVGGLAGARGRELVDEFGEVAHDHVAPCSRSASAPAPRSTPTTSPKAPFRPASTPLVASSTTTHSAGASPKRPAASR